MRNRLILTALLLPILAACPRPADDAVPTTTGPDPHSFARPDEVAVRHLSLDVAVDFDARTISGSATLELERAGGADALFLDTDGLDIRAVTAGGSPTPFALGERVEHLGRPLRIELPPGATTVRVEYASSPDAEALQWLDGFLLSQSQSIFARTWVPCQDSPAVRMTYDATVRVPPGMLALMSASNPTAKSPDGVYTFEMPQPVPAYLLALAVGDVEFRALGPTSGVYAEPGLVEAAAWEFADTPRMIEAAERLYGPYRWERYDLIVLPASFPYGGMENPRLTFVTPTVLAGDRSLVSLIAHELAHSWSGNLVTNARWGEFWLNEGFTVYLEFRIMEELYGADYAEMLAGIGLADLRDELATLPPGDTHLVVDLEGRHPDDTFTSIAYDKGYQFLRRLEHAAGRERWDAFLREYFDRFAFRSVTTEQFVAFLRERLPDVADAVDLDAWIHGPGLPADAVPIDSDAFRRVDAARAAWLAGGDVAVPDTDAWTTHEWVHFLDGLPDDVGVERLAALDAAFDLTRTGNAEILCVWLEAGLRAGYEPALPAMEAFVKRMGRNKFLDPLYGALASTEAGKARAREIFAEARDGYHPLSVASVEEVLASAP